MSKLSSTVRQDEITDKIGELFDYKFDGTITFEPHKMPSIETEFGIGLIVGPSGSGKSTLLHEFGTEQEIQWVPEYSIASHFDDATEASNKLSAVGFNSVPSWLKPYHVLSTGEKFRADIARRLGSNIVIDEFTSVVDRTVAKACSTAISRYVKNHNLKNIVLASCHYDIIDWLQPDWIYDTNTSQLVAGRGLERPQINLEIIPCGSEIWSIFKDHHYLSASLNKSSRCWLATWEDNLVGFVSALAQPSGTLKNAWREHRTVILPDYQGFGLGVRLSDAVAQMFIDDGKRYFSKTVHPRMGGYRENSPLWKPTSKNKKKRPDHKIPQKITATSLGKQTKDLHLHADRLAYSHEYIGLTT